jgi:LemA protein
MHLWITIVAVAGSLGLLAIVWISIYNRLTRLKNHCENAFAQIELQLKRRYDLIPNLVQCVKSYMEHEKTTLERVMAARNQAAAELKNAVQRPQDADALGTWINAETTLNAAMGRLIAVIESYPNLKADASVASLTEELTSTENRIAYARQSYNDWVAGFNTSRETFPTCVFADLCGFGSNRKHLEFAEGAKLAEAPQVALA